MSGRTVPTVVVARTSVPGREREFERWLRRLAAAARAAPGHLGADVQPPNDVHPGEWVIVYQFEDATSRERWLESPERRRLLDEGAELVDGEAREQVLALASEQESVTAVASFRVKPGHDHLLADFHTQLVDRLTTFPGFLRSELFEPVRGVQDETVVVFSFDTRAHLDAWLESDIRREMLDGIDEYVDARTLNVVGGFGGWFGGPGAVEVKRWKQATVVLLALYPTALFLTFLSRQFWPDVWWVLGVLIGNVFGVIILSWALMPWLTRLLAGWLRR